MLPRHHEPIVAIATARGRGAVGIVRISGGDLRRFVEALLGRTLEPRRATYLAFNDAHGAPIDQGLAIHFPAPSSYTGEDVLELQSHGGAVVLQLVVARCLEVAVAEMGGAPALPGLRLAQPGEFSERAFLNGKLDLAQAEAVADLIDASTEAAARSASRSLAGAFSVEIAALSEALIELRVLVEATLDFPEEEIDFLEAAHARERLAAVREQLERVLAQARQGALLRDGMTVVLAGQPNVGKSSLLNALAGAELAIVTEVPGTTRDRIGETIQIEGVPVHVVDTAGLRDTEDAVEKIGISRSWSAIDEADAVLLVHDLTQRSRSESRAEDARIERRLLERRGDDRIVHLYNKVDVVYEAEPLDGLAISAKTGAGIEALRARLLELAGWRGDTEGVFIARERHVEALRRARGHVGEAEKHAAQGNQALDLFAEELRLAHEALGTIVGTFSADDLLGEIFGRFCIGK